MQEVQQFIDWLIALPWDRIGVIVGSLGIGGGAVVPKVRKVARQHRKAEQKVTVQETEIANLKARLQEKDDEIKELDSQNRILSYELRVIRGGGG